MTRATPKPPNTPRDGDKELADRAVAQGLLYQSEHGYEIPHYADFVDAYDAVRDGRVVLAAMTAVLEAGHGWDAVQPAPDPDVEVPVAILTACLEALEQAND